ncbi:heterokaryon incompatibility domain-containing protein [Trichoderma chlorosporum]
MTNCEVCNDLKQKRLGLRLAIEFTPDQLKHSALVKKCQFCSIMRQGILLMQDETWSFASGVSIVNGYAFSGDTLFLEISFLKEKQKPRVVIEFFTDIAHPDPMLRRVFWPRPTRSGHPLSRQALEWVKTRMEECDNDHLCHASELSTLPDRILSLKASSEGNITIRLTEPEQALGKYATLSHRWSSNHNFITTIANLSDRKQGMPWEELPKTFQDAVRFCLELDISYLWIDALCIVQDDPVDWEVQSAKMADIYHLSCLTLAATWSDSNSTGCFPNQSAEYAEHSLEVSNSAQDNFWLKVRRKLPHWAASPTAMPTRENPLLSRAWVFQERVLSPRVLHFCLREIIWECCEHTICECGGLSNSLNLKSLFALASQLKISNDQPESESESQSREDSVQSVISRVNEQQSIGRFDPDFDEVNDQLETRERRFRASRETALKTYNLQMREMLVPVKQWHGLVEHYSKLRLTKQTDRLPALSGLAHRMAPFLGDYHAGLWRSSIFLDLAWAVDKPSSHLNRSREYIGPSWSWVSVNAGVRYFNAEDIWLLPEESYVHNTDYSWQKSSYRQPIIRSIQVKTKGKNYYGEVSSATLVVLGLLRSASLVTNPAFLSPRDMTTFELEIELFEASSCNVPSVRLPFSADSMINDRLRGSRRALYLFALFPRVCLVLLDTNLQRGELKVYQRVGIVQLAEHLESRYRIDWLKGAQYREIMII